MVGIGENSCCALARQNGRSHRGCLDFSLFLSLDQGKERKMISEALAAGACNVSHVRDFVCIAMLLPSVAAKNSNHLRSLQQNI